MNSGRRTARQEEEFHVQRRNAELRKQEHWNSVAEYFKTWDVKASKYASWTSQKYFQQSHEVRAEAEKKEKKMQTLTERREKLKHILDTERKTYEEELKNQSRCRQAGWMPLEELKTVNLEMKRRSEESRKREAELLLYQRWKQEQPTLKDLERRQYLEFMKKSWIDQVKEKEAAREKQRAEELMRAKEEELKRKEEEEFEKMRLRRKEEEILDLKQQMKRQMEAVKLSLQKYKELEIQEAEERKLQSEIQEIVTQRKLAEQKQANKQLAAYWTRQYQLKLQKKAKEVEEDILKDQRMLERLKEEFNQEVRAKAQAREIAKKEMELALKNLQTQQQRELLRQKEYEHMFYEEAKRVWEVQEQKWAQEKQARENLMHEVLETINKQVEEKLARSSAERADALKDREQLLEGMSRLYKQCNDRERQAKLNQECLRKDLDEQITEKKIENARKALEEAEIGERRNLDENVAEQKLAEEMEKLQRNPYNYRPQNFRRQRIAW